MDRDTAVVVWLCGHVVNRVRVVLVLLEIKILLGNETVTETIDQSLSPPYRPSLTTRYLPMSDRTIPSFTVFSNEIVEVL